MKFKHQRQHKHTVQVPLKRSGSKWIVMDGKQEISDRLAIYAAKRFLRALKRRKQVCNV